MAETTIAHGERDDADSEGAVRTIDFGHLFSVLRNRVLLILFVTALFGGASVVLSSFLKNYYTSTTSILVDPEGSRIVEGEIDSGNRSTEARTLNQQFILTSVKVLAAVVKSEGLADDPEFGAAQPYEADAQKRALRALATLQRAIAAELNKASFVIDLSVTSNDPAKAARIANAIAGTYIQTRVEMNTGVLRQATTDLSAQLASLEKTVEDGDRAIQAYKAEHNLIDVGGRTPVEQQIGETNTEITRISASIAENEALISELSLARSNPERLRATPDSSLTPAIIELRTRYHTALEQQSVLQASFGDRHPSLQNAKARTRAIGALLDRQLKDFVTSLSRNGEKLKSQRDLLNKNLNAFRTSLNEADQSMVRLRELERKLASDRAVYESFLLRTRQLSGQERTVSENPQIISVAQVPLAKAGPKRSLIIAGATMLGFLFGCGIALVMDRKPPRDDQAESREEKPAAKARVAEKRPARGLPAWLPWRKRSKPENPDQVAPALEAVEREAVAAFASPRTARKMPAMESAHGSYADIGQQFIREAEGHENYCLVLYSAQPRSNSYRAAYHLARSLAQSGKDVLLVDAEPEAGLTRQASAAGFPGFHDCVSMRRIEGDFLNLAGTPGLWLMPSGHKSPRISTRRSGETGNLLDWLNDIGSTFDFVIVHAGRADQKSQPAVETAADSFAVLGSRLNRKGVEETAALLRQRGLAPVVPLFVQDEQGSVSRTG